MLFTKQQMKAYHLLAQDVVVLLCKTQPTSLTVGWLICSSASPGNLLEMHISGGPSRPTAKSQTLGMGQRDLFAQALQVILMQPEVCQAAN